MNDAIGIFIVLSSVIGFIFFCRLFAELFLFLYGLLAETVFYIFRRKSLKPLTSFTVFLDAGKEADGESNRTNYASYIQKYIQSYKKSSCCFHIWKCRTIRRCGLEHNFANNTQSNSSDLPDNNLPNIAYPPVENICQHTDANVSQGEKACQPKVNDTLRWLIKIKGFHTI